MIIWQIGSWGHWVWKTFDVEFDKKSLFLSNCLVLTVFILWSLLKEFNQCHITIGHFILNFIMAWNIYLFYLYIYLCTLIKPGFLYFFNSVSKNVERFERRVLEEFTKMFTESNSFYFSLTGDITNALQRQASREPTVTVNSGPEYVQNIFSRSLKKPPTRENWDKLSV